MEQPYGKVYTALALLYMTALTKDPRYGMNLKLHHRQMHYRQGSIFKDLKGENEDKKDWKYASGTWKT